MLIPALIRPGGAYSTSNNDEYGYSMSITLNVPMEYDTLVMEIFILYVCPSSKSVNRNPRLGDGMNESPANSRPHTTCEE